MLLKIGRSRRTFARALLVVTLLSEVSIGPAPLSQAAAASRAGSPATQAIGQHCSPLLRGTQIKPESGQLELSATTLNHLIDQRQKIRRAFDLATRELLGAENYVLGVLTAQIAGYHTLLYGGPGAAKTRLIHLVNPNLWYKQLSEQTNPLSLFGGQRTQAAADGREDWNLETSITKSPIANLDEVDKAQPELLTMLLSLLNTGERWVSVAGKKIRADTRSVHFTSNLNMAKLIDRFLVSGMQGSGLAFLNRIQVKMMVPNWFEDHMMLEFLMRSTERSRKKALASVDEATRLELQSQDMPTDIDWTFLEWISEAVFTHSQSSLVSLKDIVVEFRKRQIHEIMGSAINSRYGDEPAYAPTAEMTIRLVGEIPKMIRASTLIDVLLSNLTDQQVKTLLRNPIELSTASHWRTHWMLTSVGPGLSRLDPHTLEIEPNLINHHDGTLKPLDSSFFAGLARDAKDQADIQSFVKEHAIWKSVVSEVTETERAALKRVAAILIPDEGEEFDNSRVEIEAILAKSRR